MLSRAFIAIAFASVGASATWVTIDVAKPRDGIGFDSAPIGSLRLKCHPSIRSECANINVDKVDEMWRLIGAGRCSITIEEGQCVIKREGDVDASMGPCELPVPRVVVERFADRDIMWGSMYLLIKFRGKDILRAFASSLEHTMQACQTGILVNRFGSEAKGRTLDYLCNAEFMLTEAANHLHDFRGGPAQAAHHLLDGTHCWLRYTDSISGAVRIIRSYEEMHQFFQQEYDWIWSEMYDRFHDSDDPTVPEPPVYNIAEAFAGQRLREDASDKVDVYASEQYKVEE